jgi:hypothetical protein
MSEVSAADQNAAPKKSGRSRRRLMDIETFTPDANSRGSRR